MTHDRWRNGIRIDPGIPRSPSEYAVQIVEMGRDSSDIVFLAVRGKPHAEVGDDVRYWFVVGVEVGYPVKGVFRMIVDEPLRESYCSTRLCVNSERFVAYELGPSPTKGSLDDMTY